MVEEFSVEYLGGHPLYIKKEVGRLRISETEISFWSGPFKGQQRFAVPLKDIRKIDIQENKITFTRRLLSIFAPSFFVYFLLRYFFSLSFLLSFVISFLFSLLLSSFLSSSISEKKFIVLYFDVAGIECRVVFDFPGDIRDKRKMKMMQTIIEAKQRLTP